MKTSIALVALICLLCASGCKSKPAPAPSEPATPALEAAAPTPTAPAASEKGPFAVPALRSDDIMGFSVNGTKGPFLSAERRPDLVAEVTSALGQSSLVPEGTGTPRFIVALHLGLSKSITLGPVGADVAAVDVGGQIGFVRSDRLVKALEAMDALLLRFDHSAMQRFTLDVGPDWVRKDWYGNYATWTNEKAALHLGVWSWPDLLIDDAKSWSLTDRYYWTGVIAPIPARVRGLAGTYEAVRFLEIPETTGGGFFGTLPLKIDVAGRSGALSLICGSTVSSQNASEREAAQQKADEECPALLNRFVVDLGEPIVPRWSPTPTAASLEPAGSGYRLTLPGGPGSRWEGQRGPHQWQVGAGNQRWVVDLDQGTVSPTNLAWPVPSYKLPDGTLIGALGSALVVQDFVAGKETVLAKVTGQVAYVTAVGDRWVLYALDSGQLWQLDRASGAQRLIAEKGRPVGALADGRAVAITEGAISVWRPDAPESESITPGGVRVVQAEVSPDGNRVAYFRAEAGSTSEYPRIDGVAIWECATGVTSSAALPAPGYTEVVGWDEAGNFTFSFDKLDKQDGGGLLQFSPTGKLTTLSPPDETGHFIGRDGSSLLFSSGEETYAFRPEGKVLLYKYREALGWGDLVAFPRGTGMEVLDARTGRRYWVPGLSVPYLPLPFWANLGPLRPDSGFVAMQVAPGPQIVFQIAPVTPRH